LEINNKSEEIRDKIKNDPDFINSKKHAYSLKKFLKQNPNGTTENIIAYFLCITPEDVKATFQESIKKIRQKLNIEV
jgi:hypothetical protein